jgi:hypothetical protein
MRRNVLERSGVPSELHSPSEKVDGGGSQTTDLPPIDISQAQASLKEKQERNLITKEQAMFGFLQDTINQDCIKFIVQYEDGRINFTYNGISFTTNEPIDASDPTSAVGKCIEYVLSDPSMSASYNEHYNDIYQNVRSSSLRQYMQDNLSGE